MRYISTRGEAPSMTFADVLLTGLAADGGLYMPDRYPRMAKVTMRGFAGAPYTHVAEQVIAPFVGTAVARDDLQQMISDAYATFSHPTVAPLVQIGPNDWVLELFHGRTLAFKDVAMQLLARLMDHILAQRGRRATIVGATSGDTGGAAIDAFRDSERTDVFILFPKGKVSDVQRRQMTTTAGAHVHALAIDGNFDDCQAIVKAMFVNPDFRDNVALSGVNSINWARIMAQIVYYFTAGVALGAPERPVSFTVPTGNFGDVLAGYVAKQMGLPIDRLVVATNANDILHRALDTGEYAMRGVMQTPTPSMDIQVSSNFERLLFDAVDHDAPVVRGMMESLKQSQGFTIPEDALQRIRDNFDSGRCDDLSMAAILRHIYQSAGYVLDPHTAVGYQVAMDHRKSAGPTTPMVTLATAHPAKFPQAVEAAIGKPAALPPHVADLFNREERMTELPSDQATVEHYIRQHTRATSSVSSNHGAA